MKIPLLVDDLYGCLRAFKGIMIMGLRFAGFIKFILDSGSPDTIIGTMDASRLNIPVANLPDTDSDKQVVGLDGAIISLKLIKNANLVLIDDKGSSIKIILPIYVNSKHIQKIRGQETQGNPSVLGVDFLLKNKFKFIFDPYKKEAYLEKEDN